MRTTIDGPGPLAGLQVVEHGEGIAIAYAGRLLGDLGALVIKVEGPAGDALRRRPSFSDPRGEKVEPGLLFHGLNAAKAGATLDLGRPEDQARFAALVNASDILLTNDTNDVVDGTLDVARLRAQHPGLVVAVASRCAGLDWTPAGGWMHLHAAAISGVSSMIGLSDRAPLPPPYEIGEYETGVNLAAAALAALHGVRHGRGQGQVVQVDSADLMLHLLWTASSISRYTTGYNERSGRRYPGSGGPYPLTLFPCRDGYIAMCGRSTREWHLLLAMVGSPEWSRRPELQDPWEVALHHADEVEDLFRPWFMARTRDEVLAAAREQGFAAGPASEILEVLAVPQLVHRQSLSPQIVVGGKPVTFLRFPYQFSRSGRSVVALAGPALGARAHFPLREATAAGQTSPGRPPGQTSPTRPPAQTSPTRPPTDEARSRQPGPGLLRDIRVMDLGWVWSGPMIGAVLADMGAEVIKVEHRGRLDNARLRGRPVIDGVEVEGPEEELSPSFHQNNRGKKSISLNIKDAEDIELLRDLIRSSDIVIENLTPGVYDRAGVGYEALAAEHPGLIWLSASSTGRTGPLAGLKAYAPIMTAMAGLETLVGYEDEPTVGMLATAFGDPNAGFHGLFAVLAALTERDRSGLGQFIDMSQIEATVAVLLEPAIESQILGHQPPPWGFGHPAVVPHGHYPCSGDNQWVALAATSDEMWRALAKVLGRPGLADAPGFATAVDRAARRSEIDGLIEAWTREQDRDAVVRQLAGQGIAAVPVLSLAEAEEAPGISDWFQIVKHQVTGSEPVSRTPWRFSDTPVQAQGPAPIVGQDTAAVFAEVLGIREPRLSELLARRAGG